MWSHSQLEVVGIIVLHVLTDPKNDATQHDEAIGHDIRNAHVDRGQRVVLEQILQHHDGDAACQTSRHKRKAEKQHCASLPGDTIPTVREAVGRQARLFDAVDHQHAECGADERDPVDKVDVHGRAVEGGLRVDAGVDEEEESERELERSRQGQHSTGNDEYGWKESNAYECSGEIDACGPGVGTVQPGGLGDAEAE